MIIEAKNLTKIYRLKKAVDDVSLKVQAGSVLGLLGPNGAGKSTTMNMLTGITGPTRGAIHLFGERLLSSSLTLKKRIGVMPEHPALFLNLRIFEQVYFTGRLYGLHKAILNKRLEELLDHFNLGGDQNTFIYELSAGMKKKLAFICTIIHDPEIVFLDEPFESIDPLILRIVEEIILQLAARGRTILLTSHNLKKVEKLCTHIALMNNGKLLLTAGKDEILKKIKDADQRDAQPLLEYLYLDIISPARTPIFLSWLNGKR